MVLEVGSGDLQGPRILKKNLVTLWEIKPRLSKLQYLLLKPFPEFTLDVSKLSIASRITSSVMPSPQFVVKERLTG